MRDSEAHAAKSGSVPFALRGPKSVRTLLATAVAGAIGFVPAVMVAAPAQAAANDYTLVASASGVEGQSVTFKLTRNTTAGLTAPSTVKWKVTVATADAPAAKLTDFVKTEGEVTFTGDSTSQNISVATVDNQVDEDDKNFILEVTDPDVTNTDKWTSEGVIVDDDAAPSYTLNVDYPTPKEGIHSKIQVTAKLNSASTRKIEIPVSLQAGTALAGQDYTDLTANTKIVWDTQAPTPSLESEPVEITILDDKLYEETQQDFTIKTGTVDTVTGTPTATVNVVDDEKQSEVKVGAPNPNWVAEGGSLTFPITISPVSERPISVTYNTVDGAASDISAADAAKGGKATGGSDYTTTTGTITTPRITGSGMTADIQTAAPTAIKQTVSVKTSVDDASEPSPEYFNLALSAPVIAKLATPAAASAGITDATAPPNVTLTPADVPEGNTGTVSQNFTVKLDKAAQKEITVKYLVDKLSRLNAPSHEADPGSDFIATQGNVVFKPGETEKKFSVKIIGDMSYEPDESMGIELSSDDLTPIGSQQSGWSNVYDVLIKNDDAKPTFSLSPVVMKEGNEATVAMFPIKLSNPIGQTSTWDVTFDPMSSATDSGDLPGETDYLPPSTTVTIPANQTTGYLYFLVNGDTVYENDETLNISLAPATATADWVTGDAKKTTLTLQNDDTAPSLEINTVKANEGDKVQVTAITRGATQVAVPFNVWFKGQSVDGGVAASAADFVDPGVVSVTIPTKSFSGITLDVGSPLEIVDDELKEPSETILVSGSPLAGVGKVIDGVVWIAASDGGVDTDPTDPTDPGDTKPTISAPASVKGNAQATISGKAAAGATVWLWGGPLGNSALQQLTSVKAGSNGAFSFTRSLSMGMRFQVSVGDLTSSVSTVRVQQVPVFVATSPSKGWLRLAVQGTPRAEGQSVTVQRWTAKGWVTAWTGKTGANNQWSAQVKQASGSKWTLRALVGATAEDGILAGYSVNRNVTIK